MFEGLDIACLDEMGADLDNAGGMVEMGDGLDGPCTDFDEMGVCEGLDDACTDLDELSVDLSHV